MLIRVIRVIRVIRGKERANDELFYKSADAGPASWRHGAGP